MRHTVYAWLHTRLHKVMEEEMAIHSSILARETPWTKEPGRLQSIGSQSLTRLSNFTATTTWDKILFPSHLNVKVHRPALDTSGHYCCTCIHTSLGSQNRIEGHTAMITFKHLSQNFNWFFFCVYSIFIWINLTWKTFHILGVFLFAWPYQAGHPGS